MRERYVSRVAAIAWVVLAATASACTVSGAESTPSVDRTDADVTIVSRNMAFDQATLTVTAGSAWRLKLVNEYDVPGLEPGTYFFRCDLHPDMKGTVIVTGIR